jgi:hypothetical protein
MNGEVDNAWFVERLPKVVHPLVIRKTTAPPYQSLIFHTGISGTGMRNFLLYGEDGAISRYLYIERMRVSRELDTQLDERHKGRKLSSLRKHNVEP